MAALELEGATLGEKHHNYNNLLKIAVESKKVVKPEDFDVNHCDVINLLNVDIASHNKNVDYILKVLVCDDMLYVSRAIKLSDWLINNISYAHIINPVYLRTNLYPQMCSKAFIKFLKHIRLNLKDEKRAELFYEHEDNPKDAVKWLPNCSLDFILKNIKKHHKYIKITLLRRLCEKSIEILEVYMRDEENRHEYRNALQNTMFLLSSDTNRYLDILETQTQRFNYPSFNKRTTNIVLKSSFDRITGKFENYYKYIHLPTFLKYLKKENVKTFLLGQSKYVQRYGRTDLFSDIKYLELFINFMPFKQRFEFVKQIFIDKIHDSNDSTSLTDEEKKSMNVFYKCICNNISYSEYSWYQFAPFEIAFPIITDLFHDTLSTGQKKSMLMVLITSARHNTDNIRTFLEYFQSKLNNKETNAKIALIKQILCEINLETCDQHIWKALDDTFKDIGIYTESVNSDQKILEAIVIHDAISRGKVLEIVEKKFHFNSLTSYHKNLTESAKERLFIYLYNSTMTKLQSCIITTEDEFKEKIQLLEQGLILLKDFRRGLSIYPIFIDFIRELIKIRSDNKWRSDLSSLYNVKKEWRQLLFQESLALYPTESALINALKHDPALLDLYKTEVHSIFYNNEISLMYVLSKIKIYWANSLAKDLTALYLENLNETEKHKVITRGLSILMSRDHLQNLCEQYSPKEAKINWSKVDEVTLGLQKHFAKNMHVGRPQPSPEAILTYSKGDYMQYALPSLLSIFNNLNAVSCRNYINDLLDAPVSLQKHGVRIAVSKIQLDELLPLLYNVWKSSKNATVRSVMFKSMFEILCKESELKKIKTTWNLIEMFIDNLTLQEDKSIYKLLLEVEKLKEIPLDIKVKFYIKSYKLLKSLLDAGNEEFENEFYTCFTKYSVEIMEQLCENFVSDIIKDFVDKKFTKHKINYWPDQCTVPVMSSFMLCAKNEKIQLERYKMILQPIVKNCFILWNKTENGEHFTRINLAHLLNNLRHDVEHHVTEKGMVVPFKMFLLIQKELEQNITVPENYMLLTKWQLTVSFINTLHKHQPVLNWKEACANVAIEFGNKCKDDLKEHCDKYFPRIYLLFIEALRTMLDDFIPEVVHGDIFRSLLHDCDFIQGYLGTLKMISQSRGYVGIEKEREEIKSKFKELRKIISVQPSPEIQIHYFNTFKLI